jgi:hypothetical protein
MQRADLKIWRNKYKKTRRELREKRTKKWLSSETIISGDHQSLFTMWTNC